jgi:muramoyltetrapeptide carboxypeptidase
MSDPFLAAARVRRGDLVGVCAPSGPVEEERLARGVATLERLGFRVRVPDGILERTGFTAGSVERRACELEALLRDEEVRAVVCARGGAGAIDLMERLDDDALFLADPKPIVGFSDVTFLHLVLGRIGIVGLLGPMVARGLDGTFDEASFVHALTGEGASLALPPEGLRVLRMGEGEGLLLGGCLSILAAAAGTRWALRCDVPQLLFVEDVNEPPYRIHRMLRQLRLSGALANLRGVVFGEMAGCRDSAGLVALDEVVAGALEGLDVPVAIGLAAGHTTKPSLTLPLGVPARLRCDALGAHFEVLGQGVR